MKIDGTSRTARRGVAMLMVLIALVVGTTLTAGFLLTQGTSIGIAKNQRDYDASRSIAETGIDLCLWQIKNTSNWRTALTPGTWISKLSVGAGTVTVTAADGGGNASSFSSDYTQSVLLTSVATVNGRTYTVTASIKPSAGGTPFSRGAFASAGTTLKNSALVDSYNTTVGAYASSKANNAILGSASNANGSLYLNNNSSFLGSYVAGPTAGLGACVTVGSGATAPSSISNAVYSRNLGTIVLPNTVGFSSGGSYSKSSSAILSTTNVSYSSLSISNNSTVFCTQSSQYIHVTGNVSIGSGSTLSLINGCNVVLVVDGNLTNNGTISLSNSGSLTIYANNTITLNGGSSNNASGANSSLLILGTTNCTSINIGSSSTTAAFNGVIYAPYASIDIGASTACYGSMICQQLTLEGSAALHLDDAVKTLAVHNLTGGTTMGDYSIVWRE